MAQDRMRPSRQVVIVLGLNNDQIQQLYNEYRRWLVNEEYPIPKSGVVALVVSEKNELIAVESWTPAVT